MSDGRGWVCRVRFCVPRNNGLPLAGQGLDFDLPDGRRAELRAVGEGGRDFALFALPFASETEAAEWGERWSSSMKRAFAQRGLAINVGDRRNIEGGLTSSAHRVLEEAGVEFIRNERLGVHVYRGDARPRWVRTFAAGIAHGNAAALMAEVSGLLEDAPLSPQEQVAFEFWSAARFLEDTEVRFLLFFMALEALAEPIDRSDAAKAHVAELARLTIENKALTKSDRASMIGSLRWLRQESIRQTGMRFCRTLQADLPGEWTPADVYNAAYDIRNLLTHPRKGLPEPDRVREMIPMVETLVRAALRA